MLFFHDDADGGHRTHELTGLGQTRGQPWLFDHHVHSNRSDGAISLEDRARTARSVSHGISDHYPCASIRDEVDVWAYVEAARGHGLRVGLEYDLDTAAPLSPNLHAALDYLIGSIHSVRVDGTPVYFTAAAALVRDGQRGRYDGSEAFAEPAARQRLLTRMLELVQYGVEVVGIDILGHITLSPLWPLGEPEDVYPTAWQESLIDLCVQARVAIEVNERYGVPHAELLGRAARAGAMFAVGSDAHNELAPLTRVSRVLASIGLPPERFLSGQRIRAFDYASEPTRPR